MPKAEKSKISCLLAVVYAMWPAVAWATSVTLGETLVKVPGLAWVMVLMLSAISGLAALLNRLKDDTPPRLRLFVAAHMLGSLVAGVLAFFLAQAVSLGDFAQAGAIASTAWAGARWLDARADNLIKKAKEE